MIHRLDGGFIVTGVLKRKLMNRVSRALLSARTRDLQRGLARSGRALLRRPRRVHYFHQVDDPYSHLASQTLTRLGARYEIELVIHLAGPPPGAAAPDRERLIAYARVDAAAISGPYGLSYADPGRQPTADSRARASRILAGHLDALTFAELAPRVGEALWRDDADALADLERAFAPASDAATCEAIAAGTRKRERLQHYSGATFYYEGEWYWGVDRLHYLERRLIEEGARRRPGQDTIVPRLQSGQSTETGDADMDAPGGRAQLTLECFVSLRSPYCVISMARTFALAQRWPIDLVLRPVLPMVMRGLPVPLAKKLYIVRDTKREAEDLGIPFGDVFDPVGRPVERAFSLYPFAKQRGRGGAFLDAFMQDAWGGGIDTGTDDGLRHSLERAGLSWAEALAHLDSEDWRAQLEANREQMLAAGLWGVPSYRVLSAGTPDSAIWGQDRLWLVEREIRRRLGV